MSLEQVAGERVTLGMFGYDIFMNREHFRWLVRNLIESGGNYEIYIAEVGIRSDLE